MRIKKLLRGFDVLSGPTEVTVTSKSQTLEELGVTIESGIHQLMLIPVSAGISWASGEATAGINAISDAVIAFDIQCTFGIASLFEFITAGDSIKMTVIQKG